MMTPEQFAELMQAIKSISDDVSCLTGMIGVYFAGRLFGFWK